MHSSEMSDSGKMAYQTGIFDGLKVQDSFTVIAFYAARLDPEDCEEDTDRVKQRCIIFRRTINNARAHQ